MKGSAIGVQIQNWSQYPRQSLTREQLLAVLAAAKAESERNWLLILVTYWHGLRATEAISLTPDHFAEGCLTVQRAGGSPPTAQPLVDHENQLLNERLAVEAWLGRHGGDRDRRLFPISPTQFYRIVRRCGRAAGLPQHLSHPHILRQSIAVHLLQDPTQVGASSPIAAIVSRERLAGEALKTYDRQRFKKQRLKRARERRKRKLKPEHLKEQSAICDLVEKEIGSGPRTRKAVVTARYKVFEEAGTDLDYDTIAEYHRRELARRRKPLSPTN